ncbi:MAG: transposase [Planctomycetes bacterium]|nr:transposase [Planctomycetota bacterium]
MNREPDTNRNQRRIIDSPHYAHFLTFTVYRRRRLLDHDVPKRFVLGILNHQLTAFSAQCAGFVIMPDHVHAIVRISNSRPLTQFMHGWKRMSSFKIREWYREHAPEYCREFGEGDRFWQAKYHSFEIEQEAKLREKLEYMHMNPVRAGLVERTVDWPWSSARWYEQQRTVGVPISWLE